MIRPCRFILCNNHSEWQKDWVELWQHLTILDQEGVEYYNVDEFPLHLQQGVSKASEISIYRPDTCIYHEICFPHILL